ncbi:hypothetical protein MHAS_00330 [Mycolicibacterium hassiacum DSM 44199]|uniref:hypothetical protein n=1 Tax=Mycolicibacterium hassiacum TaxID=46351 RepID=UPI00038285AF|nr:hypothetical protein [Mycolicibacterium hassiacum]MDA4087046.1 hypothetical protein [Mycolicibacterium hassiacum DSM 44199]VCT88646.1 hypothetical protein MHAS_00330 [Mycolicibacterium hassiacum DSM 44199]
MNVKTLKTVGTGAVLGGSLLFTAGLGIALAQPGDTVGSQDDRVNITIGNAGVLEDVEVAAASRIAAGICDVETTQVTGLIRTADADGTERTVCTVDTLGAVTVAQNVPGQAEGAPGHAQGANHTVPGETPAGVDDYVPGATPETVEPGTPGAPHAEGPDAGAPSDEGR